MKNFRMYESSINEKYLDEIVSVLRNGGIIIYPTDSLYAIGCDALNNRAVERVCAMRGINPAKQRLSMVCGSISQASEFARIDNGAFAVLRKNLPGPFTFILPASNRLARAFKGRKEVGVRVPDNAIAVRIANELGNPLLSATADWLDADAEELALAEAVKLHFEPLGPDAFVDAGDVAGEPSAVVDLTDSGSPEMLREGPRPLE